MQRATLGGGGTAGGSGPRQEGKAVLHTTLGDIDLSFYTREAPMASRNFLQHCLDGYYNSCKFFRVIKGFMVQSGDPTNTGKGGESIWGQPFKDECTPRLRFSRRGILACANENVPNSNHSQWFLTLGDAEHLNGKNTIFGTVTGNTLFNLVRIGQLETNSDDVPLSDVRVTGVSVLENPFPDMSVHPEPRGGGVGDEQQTERRRKKKRKRKAVNNQNLLSFGDDGEGGDIGLALKRKRDKKKNKKKKKGDNANSDDSGEEDGERKKRRKKDKRKKKKKDEKVSNVPDFVRGNGKEDTEEITTLSVPSESVLPSSLSDELEKRKAERARKAEEKLKKLERFRSALSLKSKKPSWMSNGLVFTKKRGEDDT